MVALFVTSVLLVVVFALICPRMCLFLRVITVLACCYIVCLRFIAL